MDFEATVFPGGVVIPNYQVARWLNRIRTAVTTPAGLLDVMALYTDVLFGAGTAPVSQARNRQQSLHPYEYDDMLVLWDEGDVVLDPSFVVFAQVLNEQMRIYRRVTAALYSGEAFRGTIALDLGLVQRSSGVTEAEADEAAWQRDMPAAVVAFLRGL